MTAGRPRRPTATADRADDANRTGAAAPPEPGSGQVVARRRRSRGQVRSWRGAAGAGLGSGRGAAPGDEQAGLRWVTSRQSECLVLGLYCTGP